MSCSLWLEPVDSMRSDSWFAQVRRDLAPQDQALLLVPDGTPTQDWLERLFGPAPSAHGGLTVATYREWATTLDPLAPPEIPQALALCLLHDMVHESAGSIQDLAGIYGTLQWAMRAGHAPTDLSRLARDARRPREARLATLFATYVARLHDTCGMIDPEQRWARAVETLCAAPHLSMRRLVCDLPLESSPQIMALLRACTTHANVSLHGILPTTDADETMASYCTTLAQPYGDLFPRDPAPVSAHELTRARGAVSLHRLTTPHAEVRATVAAIVDALEQGTPPDGIGLILTRNAPLRLWGQALHHVGLLRRHILPLLSWSAPLDRLVTHEASWHTAPAQASISTWLEWTAQHLCPPSNADASSDDPHVVRLLHLHRECTRLHQIVSLQPMWSRLAPLMLEQFRRWLPALFAPRSPWTLLRASLSIGLFPFATRPPRRLDHLFLPHAMESTFPQGNTPQDFISARPNIADQLTHDALCLRRWQAAADHLHISVPECTTDGTPLMPSHLVTQLLTATSGTECCVSAPFIQTHRSPGDSINYRVAHESALRRVVTHNTAGHHFSDPQVLADIQRRYRDHTFSVTELQTFRRCPVAFIAQYLLGIHAGVPESLDIDQRTTGTFLHRALARWYRQHWPTLAAMPHPLTAQDDETLARLCRESVEAITPTLAEGDAHLHPLFRQRLVNDTMAILHATARQDHAWMAEHPTQLFPTEFEWRFEATLPSQTGVPIALRGTIDRLDINANAREILVIDYKTGRPQSIRGALTSGEHLQLPLYWHAVARAFPDHRVIGGLLFHVRHGVRCHGLVERERGKRDFGISGRQGSSVTEEQLATICAQSEAMAVDSARAIGQGAIPLQPHACDFCDWRGQTRLEMEDAWS
jgi:RecB family exonuclease